MRIWKYPFRTTDEFTLDLPKDAQILSVQMQGIQPCIWAQVHPKNELEKRHFIVYGTGHYIPNDKGVYIGTYQEFEGGLIWHLFEVKE